MRKLAVLVILIAFGLSFAGCKGDPDATYRVTYLANTTGTYGTVPVDPNQYTSGEEAVVRGKGTLGKEGYAFDSWNTNADGSGDTYVDGDTITITGAVFLYAIWAEVP